MKVPKYLKNKVTEIWYESENGWWAGLKSPWTIDGCVACREDTLKALKIRIRDEAVKNEMLHR